MRRFVVTVLVAGALAACEGPNVFYVDSVDDLAEMLETHVTHRIDDRRAYADVEGSEVELMIFPKGRAACNYANSARARGALVMCGDSEGHSWAVKTRDNTTAEVVRQRIGGEGPDTPFTGAP